MNTTLPVPADISTKPLTMKQYLMISQNALDEATSLVDTDPQTAMQLAMKVMKSHARLLSLYGPALVR
jgi:anaerobic ribonucleoside-triphosphate reductase